MNKRLSRFSKKQSLVYKVFLFIASTLLVIYLLPRGGQFKYDFQKGKPWQYENLYAPFSFTIKKSEEALENEKADLRKLVVPYFDLDIRVIDQNKTKLRQLLSESYVDTLYTIRESAIYDIGSSIIDQVNIHGLSDEIHAYSQDQLVYLKNGNEVDEITYGQILKMDELDDRVLNLINGASNSESVRNLLEILLKRSISPNVTFNNKLTEAAIESELKDISPNRGIIEKDGRIIAKGEVVEGDTFQILNSLKAEYQSEVWSESNRVWLLVGYALLVSLVFLMLFLFLNKYRKEIFSNNTKVTFIFFNIVLMVFLTTFIVKLDAAFVYVVPLCILPLILKAFFDPRLGLFVHVLTLLLLGFIVPNSFEYLFLQIIAGIVTILTVSELYRRANLFISVGQITLIYIVGYFAFFIIQEGNIQTLELETFGYFILCGLATLFAHPLIYFYEKLFGLVSDVSLLELSDTNTKLLKELANKAPGTFHHSLNVANLSEAAANEIGANAMLVRVGALYHDIGKMINPTYFTENQLNAVNTHNELAPKESARIIIDHVIKGIEIARKNNLPDRIIDFIRTHHGTNLVYFFYSKEKEISGEADPKDFMYPGPIPFSKETAILMMADSVEAASKSLKEPTSSKIDAFVEKIVSVQMENGQFLNANITFKEIQTIKKVLKKKLNNIYHLRVEYPE
ncbi:MAG: HDIG domain-containing protein [Bacteroidia bacterium]|nr:HDIG domain-containing protein [Bacteroidia bacterium]NNF31306.1 HDIG domain-containing protein [Flavobacteriaceae bacterium]MBT8274602.1 HDIG domain-containing protein [Bacteroidia bacterium]NNJ82136.1 HDIG domain-containing protein [Flavobacteriaceae bacterium]NNK54228.1 HDIG domain-containing protein [Flavobacteriaceae bacterium]